jgi:hypothetical protein
MTELTMTPTSTDQPDSGQRTLTAEGKLSHCRLRYPPHREPSFEVAVETASNIARLIEDLLKRMPEKTNRQPPYQLLLQAEELTKYRCPTEKLVGLIGDSGAGKSSSLNSIMGQRDLAKTEANGSAVTPFAAEYAFQRPQQQVNFTLECGFMDPTEVGKYIATLLVDFRRFAFATPEELKHDREVLESDYEAAKAVFETAFGPMEGFDLAQLEYEDDEDSREEALDYVQDYIAALEFPEAMQEDGSWRHDSEDIDDCQQQQSLLIERGLWPFVKTLRISGDIDILSRGLTLIDLPGFKDTNVARIRAARRAMSRCDQLCLVVRIDRVVDDPIVPETLGYLRERADECGKDGFNGTIICTRCADMSNRRSLEKMANAAEVRASKEAVAKVEQNQDDYTVRQYNTALKLAQLKLDKVIIQARNQMVTANLKRKYASWYGTGELKVFCIDNMLFEDNDFEESKVLSGIPALRQDLEDISAESLFMDKDAFVGKMLPALVGSFGTWMDSCRIKLEREDCLRLPEVDELKVTKNTIVAWEERMKHMLVECIDIPLDQAAARICLESLKVARQWEGWHWLTKRAFARRNGTHTTAKVGRHCWNTELLTCFKAVTAEKWYELTASVQPLIAALDTTITDPWRQYTEQCRKLEASENFLISLSARHKVLQSEVTRAKEFYFKEMEKLTGNANAAGPGSDIVDCMLDTYAEIAELYGE